MSAYKMDWASTLLGRGKIRSAASFTGRHYKGIAGGMGAIGAGGMYARNQYQNRGRSSATRGLQGRSSGGMM